MRRELLWLRWLVFFAAVRDFELVLLDEAAALRFVRPDLFPLLRLEFPRADVPLPFFYFDEVSSEQSSTLSRLTSLLKLLCSPSAV